MFIECLLCHRYFCHDSFIYLKFMSVLVGCCTPLSTDETIKGPVMKAVMSQDLCLGSVDSQPSLHFAVMKA